MRPEILTSQFQKSLQEQGYPVDDILSDVTSGADKKQSPVKVIRRWTGLPNNAIREGLFNDDRDVVSPRINGAILGRLEAWIDTKTDEGLPAITIKELSRTINLSPEKIIGVLSKYPLSFSVNGSSFSTGIQRPEFPNGRLTLSDSSEYGLSPSRVARAARYQSRPPGGGPVQKAGIQDRDVDGVIRKRAWGEQEVQYNKILPSQEEVEYGVIEELEVPARKRERKAEEIIYSEPEGAKIMQVFQWFKEVGLGKNWVYKGNEAAFAENLVKLSRGEPVDFLIWNCIGFKWFEDAKGDMATCDISDNLDAAITPFFQQRIQETAAALSVIGNPNITILVPSNEAFDARVWKYRQSEEEREGIIDQAVDGLADIFELLPLPQNVRLDVMRWDDYLTSRCVRGIPEDYSQEGENRLRKSKGFGKIIKEAVQSGRGYFASNGIKNISDEVFASRQVMYYGVYAGEGVVFEELQERGRGVVVVNFEEKRVPQMVFLGALGNLAIVTPISTSVMVNYYQWETRQIGKRK